MTNYKPATADDAELKSSLKSRHLTMIGLGGVIGAGLFVGSGVVINNTGPAVVFTYILASALIIVVMRMLGEMAVAKPSTASFSLYAREAIGNWAGFSVAWLYWYFWVIVVAFEAVAGAKILGRWIDAPLWLMSLIILAVMTTTNLVSVRSYGEFEYWFASIKVVAVLVFLGAGAAWVLGLWPDRQMDFSNLSMHGGFAPNGVSAVVAGIAVVFLSLCGAEVVTIAAAESQNPAKWVARAVRTTIARVIVFFVGSTFLIVTILPWNSTEVGESPYVSVLDHMGVPAAANIMNLVVLTAVLSCLNSGLYTVSRMLYSLARNGEAPRKLAQVNRRGVPTRAVLASTLGGYVCIGAAYLWPDSIFLFLLNSSGALVLLVYLFITVAQIRMRRLLEQEAPQLLQLPMWWFPWLSYAAVAAIVAVLVTMAVDPVSRSQVLLSLLAFAVILVAYAVQRKFSSPPKDTTAVLPGVADKAL
nr:amino acid permease [Mycolicibacterium sp. P9-22]